MCTAMRRTKRGKHKHEHWQGIAEITSSACGQPADAEVRGFTRFDGTTLLIIPRAADGLPIDKALDAMYQESDISEWQCSWHPGVY